MCDVNIARKNDISAVRIREEPTTPNLLMLPRHLIRTLTNSILLDTPVLITSPCHVCTNRIRLPSAFTSTQPGTRFGSSSGRWQTRQSRDRFTKEAKVQGLKSRAAFKLLEVEIPLHRWFSTKKIANHCG